MTQDRIAVYLLTCADGSYYVGMARDPGLRVERHNAGEAVGFTRARRPVVLSYVEWHDSTVLARRRERQIKRWSRAKKQALIVGDTERLRGLARRRRP